MRFSQPQVTCLSKARRGGVLVCAFGCFQFMRNCLSSLCYRYRPCLALIRISSSSLKYDSPLFYFLMMLCVSALVNLLVHLHWPLLIWMNHQCVIGYFYPCASPPVCLSRENILEGSRRATDKGLDVTHTFALQKNSHPCDCRHPGGTPSCLHRCENAN